MKRITAICAAAVMACGWGWAAEFDAEAMRDDSVPVLSRGIEPLPVVRKGIPRTTFQPVTTVLPDDVLNALRERVAAVPGATRAAFEREYANWREYWRTVAFSSNSRDYARGAAFERLAAMGEPIVPLILERAIRPEEHFALHLFERIESDAGRTASRPKDESPEVRYAGQQEHAKRALLQWLAE